MKTRRTIGRITAHYDAGRALARIGEAPKTGQHAMVWQGYKDERERMRRAGKLPQLELPLAQA